MRIKVTFKNYDNTSFPRDFDVIECDYYTETNGFFGFHNNALTGTNLGGTKFAAISLDTIDRWEIIEEDVKGTNESNSAYAEDDKGMFLVVPVHGEQTIRDAQEAGYQGGFTGSMYYIQLPILK